jgi:leucyl aminopeptidase (aminopeptidase T)
MSLIELMRGARIAVETCLAVKPDEAAVIVTDYERQPIAEALTAAVAAVGGDPVVTVMRPRERNAQEPPASITAALCAAQVAFLITTRSLSHTTAREKATRAGVRLASMPGVTSDMMRSGGMTADYAEVARISDAVTAALLGKKEIVIESALGTRLRLGKAGREPAQPPDNGLYHKPGEWGNLPAGEAFLAPLETEADGVLVVDGSLAQIGIPDQPVRLEFRGGRVVTIDGARAADRLRALLEGLNDPSVYTVGEFGIGTNPASRFVGITVEDEKILGTAHVAIGRNTGFGGTNMAPIHLDFVITRPTILGDGEVIMRDGKLRV